MTDTIFIKEIDKRSNPTDPLSLLPDYAEHLTIIVKSSDPSSPSGKQQYLEGDFLSISKYNNNTASVDFDFSAYNAWLYDTRGIELIELLKDTRKNQLTTKYKAYQDVIVIESRDTEYKGRDNSIRKIYWSKGDGYVRYDLNNGTSWELLNKYNEK